MFSDGKSTKKHYKLELFSRFKSEIMLKTMLMEAIELV